MNCEYCNTFFKTKSSLNNHKIKAKYCLILQGKIESKQHDFKCYKCDKTLCSKRNLEIHTRKCNGKKIEDVFECKYCNKILSSKQNLVIHENKCRIVVKENNYISKTKNQEIESLKKEKDTEIESLKKEKDTEIEKLIIKLNLKTEFLEKQERINKELQDKLERLATTAINRPTTTNTTTNNTLNISSFIDFNDIDKVKNAIENKLDIKDVIDGQKGLARFVKNNLLTDENGNLNYKCSDSSRCMFKYKDSSGEIKKDIEAKKLTDYILNGGIRSRSADIGNEWCKDEDGDINMTKFDIMLEQQQSIMKLRDDNTSFKKELASITS